MRSSSDLEVCVFLIAVLGITWHWNRAKGQAGETATTVLGASGMGMCFAFAYYLNHPIMRLGVVLFVIAGLVITPDRHKVHDCCSNSEVVSIFLDHLNFSFR